MRTTEHASYNRQAPALPLAMKQSALESQLRPLSMNLISKVHITCI